MTWSTLAPYRTLMHNLKHNQVLYERNLRTTARLSRAPACKYGLMVKLGYVPVNC